MTTSTDVRCFESMGKRIAFLELENLEQEVERIRAEAQAVTA